MPGCAWEGLFSASERKRWLDAMPRRFSCRSFSGPADVAQLSALHYLAARCEMPGVRLTFQQCDGSRLFFPVPLVVERIEYASQYAAVITDSAHPLASLHAGIAGQALCLEATHLGLGSCWVSGTFHRKQVDAELYDGERVAAVIPFGQYLGEPVSAPRKPLSALCQDDPAKWPLWAYEAAEAARSAPSAVNRQPWRFAFTGKTLMLTGRGFGSLDYGIAILHMDCALSPYSPSYRFGQDDRSLLINIQDNDESI